MRKVIEHLELVLTAAGLLVIFLAHFFFGTAAEGSSWMLTAITATAVGVIHGGIFWAVRRRQRLTRRHALAEARRMLKDIVNNQLCVIQFTADLQSREQVAIKDAHARISTSVNQINVTLNNISEESLSIWKDKYGPEATPDAELEQV